MIHPIADLPLSSRHRVSQITFHPTQPYLAVQSHDRSVEIFRIRTEEEVKKKQVRRKKRLKEKKDKSKGVVETGEDEMDADNDPQVKLVDLFTPHLVVRASGKIRSFDFGSDAISSRSGTQVDLYLHLRGTNRLT
jgi:U3 small nucleolar RNA-associated protein 12